LDDCRRPVSDKVWDEKQDSVTQESTKPAIPFHFSKIKRKQEVDRAKKVRKLEWLRRM
jgi:hypothetical protein